jgi:xylan 1,4-beta-xylosidase
MARHLLTRYGEKVAADMMFEVWNEPNIGFWSGNPKQETYFKLYKETADAFTRVSKLFKVGGPSTAGCPGWISDLQKFVAGNNPPTKLDFVTCHSYGGGNDEKNVGNIGFIDSFAQAKKAANGLPLVVTEW